MAFLILFFIIIPYFLLSFFQHAQFSSWNSPLFENKALSAMFEQNIQRKIPNKHRSTETVKGNALLRCLSACLQLWKVHSGLGSISNSPSFKRWWSRRVSTDSYSVELVILLPWIAQGEGNKKVLYMNMYMYMHMKKISLTSCWGFENNPVILCCRIQIYYFSGLKQPRRRDSSIRDIFIIYY